MVVAGLQKLSLLDYPQKICATVFTRGCNFLCPFCHNAPLVTGGGDESVPQDEFFKFLERRKGLLDGVCITGGEPLLQPDIEEFIAKIRALGFCVKLDTNGSFPDKLERLLEGGCVDYVAMDIKNSLPKYGITVGKSGFDTLPIERSVALLRRSQVPHEFRTTVVRELHTPQDIVEIGEWLRGGEKYYLQAFVDSGNLIGSGMSGYDAHEMEAMAKSVKNCFSEVGLRGI